MIKAILLDVDGTLLDFDKCARWSIDCAAQDLNVSLPLNIMETFHRINDGLWLKIEKKELTRAELRKVRWKLIFEALGLDYDGNAFEDRFFSYLSRSSETCDGAKDIVKYLSEKYMLCIASNAMVNQQVVRLTKAGMYKYVKKMFVSEKIGAPKPDKEFFDGCFKELEGIKKEEVIIIGDSISADIKGGGAYGIKTCWFNPKKNKAPLDVKIDYTVNYLEEIKNIL